MTEMPNSDAEKTSSPAAESSLDERRLWLREIIFETDTPLGRAFDLALLGLILFSVVAVMLESVQSVEEHYGNWLRACEWGLTVIFTIEYGLRLWAVRRPFKYAFSFFGIIDLLAVIPTYLSLFCVGSQHLLVIRTIRLLRVFRVLKLARYTGAADILITALRASRQKITVFLFGVLTLVTIVGSVMYLIEGRPEEAGQSGFTSIPKSIYWAIVTITTVGYGDITPTTTLGQILSAGLMIVGYAIIAVPTGIVSVEIAQASQAAKLNTKSCPDCTSEGHDDDAVFCKACGAKLLS